MAVSLPGRTAFVGSLLMTGMLLGAADGGRGDISRVKLAALESQIAAKKGIIRQAWQEVHRLDRLIAQYVPPVPDVPPALPDESIAGAEKMQALLDLSFERGALESQRQSTLQSLLTLYQEMVFLEDQARTARTSVGRRPPLDGTWNITLMPQGLRGQINLDQKGAIVSGDYQLEGGLSGSVQGTFVNGQVSFERIDSKFGKMGRFEGQLMKEETRIQGTWWSYDVMSGQPMSGPFAMEKLSQEPPQGSD